LELPYGRLQPMSQRRVVIPLQQDNRAEGHSDRPPRRKLPRVVQPPVEPIQPDRHDRYAKPGRYHRRAWLEAPDLAAIAPATLRKDQDRVPTAHQVPDVAHGLARAGLPLWEREG